MEKCFNTRVKEAMEAVAAISASQAREFRGKHPETLFLDPRSQDDIVATTGRIPGAINCSLDLLESDAGTNLPDDLQQHRTIITACQGGPMGALAAHALKRRGFTKVYFMEGGTQGWLDAGYSTERH